MIQKGTMSSSLIHKEIAKKGDNASCETIKRELSELVKQGYITISGAGRSVAYTVGTPGRIFSDINAREYCVIEPDKRYGMKRYNFNLFPRCRLIFFRYRTKNIGKRHGGICQKNGKSSSSDTKKRAGTHDH